MGSNIPVQLVTLKTENRGQAGVFENVRSDPSFLAQFPWQMASGATKVGSELPMNAENACTQYSSPISPMQYEKYASPN